MLRSTSRNTLRAVAIASLTTLPLTILPILNGILGGVLMSFWKDRRVEEQTRSLLDEIDNQSWMSSFSVPGAQSFSDFYEAKYSPFKVPRLTTRDWTAKLGLQLPQEFFDDDRTQINELGSLDHAMRDISCQTGAQQYWVYVSLIANSFGFTDQPWDDAFERLVTESYVKPFGNDTELSYIKCADSKFLCGVWNVQAPTLMHFSVDRTPLPEDSIDPSLTYTADWQYLRPVTVRIIEFPLEDAYTGLPISVFPSEYQQMRSIMRQEGLYEQFEPYDAETQVMRRFNDYADFLEWKSKPLRAFWRTNRWIREHMMEPLRIEYYFDVLQEIVLLVALCVTELVRLPFKLVWAATQIFLGSPQEGDRVVAKIDARPDNLMEGMFGGFLGHLQDQMEHRFDAPTAQA